MVFNLTTGCLRCEAEFQVHALIDHNPGSEIFRAAGIPFFSHGAVNRPGRDHWRSNIGAVVRLAKALRRDRVDLVQVHDFFPGVMGRLAAGLAGTPKVIATLHNTYSWLGPRHGFVNRILARRTSLVVGVSQACVDDSLARDRLPIDKYRVVHNGVDSNRFHPDPILRASARAMLGFSDSDFVVGNIGTLSSRKGQASLLRGIGNVVGRYPSLKVVVVGSQREHEKDIARELFESASLGDMAGRVLFLEARNDVDALLNAFDIFAMPSRQEGFGIALVEAMATGLPCLVSDIPSFRELTKGSESVLFHPVDDHEAVASQLDRMISSPLLREGLSRNAMETARGRFSKEVMLAKWEKIYRQVLRENSQPGPAREDQTRQDRAI